jgi:hypothetical protein
LHGWWVHIGVNKLLAIATLMAVGLLAGVEIGFIQGSMASLILVSGLMTSFVLSGVSVETLEVEGYGLTGKAKGQSTLVILCFFALVGLGYMHHISEETILSKVLEAMTENTYVLSLSQAEREKLNIAMPDSLRKKLR